MYQSGTCQALLGRGQVWIEGSQEKRTQPVICIPLTGSRSSLSRGRSWSLDSGPFRRHSDNRSLHHTEKRLLYTFTSDVTRPFDPCSARFPRYLIDLIDVDYACTKQPRDELLENMWAKGENLPTWRGMDPNWRLVTIQGERKGQSRRRQCSHQSMDTHINVLSYI
jgi:hypothetical protein